MEHSNTHINFFLLFPVMKFCTSGSILGNGFHIK